MNSTAEWAREIARHHLQSALPRRWAHTQGVARQARTLAPLLGDRADLLEAAAWLHDVGYAPDLVVTGFHPLDGARFLRDVHQADEHLCRLVAHHTCAVVEARERGLVDELTSEFGTEPPELTDSLIYCDMTTSPDGEELAVEDRLSEILSRYGGGHLVSRSITTSSPYILGAVHRVQDELSATRSHF
ncbi:HD domain-containing protein [Actinomadura bangladeshensis]|uniref:HD domain-containing protein n=1 Tax=Actinomadura bangladeshensis TaxID=453573 RepID=A0A4V2XLT5_9ACTN|nr:HD domain-containing protein [Actinomadura bangladeshensis]TDC11626.1 HD domain-containing protein [Actinomadura bangladeshensis]